MKVLVCVAVLLGLSGCGSSASGSSSTSRLRSAADATAKAQSFTLALVGADVVYQAPDRTQQVEHGQGSSAASTYGGSVVSSGPYDVTTTKILIGDRYYEASTPDGQLPQFTVTSRCASDRSAADFVTRLLRAIATSGEAGGSGDTFTFRIPSGDNSMPTSGIATVSGGYVSKLTFSGWSQAITIGAVNSAPPVTAPGSASAVERTCGS